MVLFGAQLLVCILTCYVVPCFCVSAFGVMLCFGASVCKYNVLCCAWVCVCINTVFVRCLGVSVCVNKW